MTLIARLARRLTFDMTRNPAPPEPAPTPLKRENGAAHQALKTMRAMTTAKLRAEVYGEGA